MRRNVLVAAVLGVLLAVVQLVAGNPWWAVLLTALLGFLVALGVLWVAERYSRRV